MKAKRLSSAQLSSLDIITTLPQTIIETILCLLPIEEAARTSILSREWRYKWTKIPKLVFSLPYESKTMEINKLVCAIHHVMLLRQDAIHEFTLCTVEADLFSKIIYPYCEIDRLILQLSNHMLKKFTLELGEFSTYNLPLSIFLLHNLTELCLRHCDLNHQLTSNGFGKLTSLSLHYVRTSTKSLLHFLSNCPSLKIFSLLMFSFDILGHEGSTMIELFKCLPMIEQLTISGDIIQWFVPDLVPEELPNSLIHLKYFCIDQMCFLDGYALTFLAVLIKSSPNLEKFEVEIFTDHFLCNEIDYDSDLYDEYHSDVWLEHISNVWLEHLNQFKLKYYSNLEPELEFVKFILARSPKLKKASIISALKKYQEYEMLKTLLRAPRASGVEIDVV